jgi:outer membrane protein TolC
MPGPLGVIRKRGHLGRQLGTGGGRMMNRSRRSTYAGNRTHPLGGACGRGILLLAVLSMTFGCTRAYYRRQADTEVNCIIDNKSAAVGSLPGQFRIEIDPRSRMYDGTSPDCPPMPPDDPTSHQLMHCVDCKPGSPCWRHMPTTPVTENPTWKDHLPRDDEGNVVLDLTGAVQVALLHSPEYQEQLETLYLSGLDVSFERFRFDTQFFGGSSIFYEAEGPIRAGRPAGSSRLIVEPSRLGNRFRAEKLTATGGELVVGFANSLMWQFAGPDNYSSRSIIDFNLVQPLLRAGGRIRVMERLTIAERALLANVRQMEHYRRGFYLSVVTGEDPGEGPNRRGGFFGGSGLEGFSGVGGGGFGRVGQFFGGFGQQGFGFTGGAGAQQAGGYIGLLQTAQVIRNQYSNIASLGDSVEQLQAAHDAGRIDRFQVDLARQALYNAQSQLLNSQSIYENTLDNFKLQHGLPPDLPVKIADPMLDHFNLLDPDLATVQIRVTDVLTVLREGVQAAEPGGPNQPLVLPVEPPPEQETEEVPTDFATLVQQAAELNAAAQERLAVAQNDYRRLQEALPERRKSLQRLAERDDAQQVEIDPDLLSVEQLDARVAQLGQELDVLSQRMGGVRTLLDQLTANTDLPPLEHRAQLTAALTLLSGELLELSLLQARARLDAITFDPVDLTPEEAYCIASRYRRDWMNARAALVDSWRLIHFNANDLESDLDLIFSGDIENATDNPFSFRGADGRVSVGLQFDAPLTRLGERNTYRQSLIEFQQARRQYYQFRDRVQRNLRATLRQLGLDDLNFELRRAAVHVGITQVDLTRLRLSEPSRPVAPSAPGVPAQPGGQAQLGATVARDLVNALIDLLNVQNDFLSVWVDHEVQRLQLDFELGVMELDDNGQRIEHAQSLKSFLAELPHSAPYELPSPCEGVVPDPSMMPAPAESGDSPETLPEPRALEIPSPLGGTNDESPAEVRRLPTLTGDPRPADAQQQEAVPAVLLDHRG